MEAHIPTIGSVQGDEEVKAPVEITYAEYEALDLLANTYLDSMAVVIERCGGPYEAFIEEVVTPIKQFVFRELEEETFDIPLNKRDEDLAPEHPGG